MITMSLHTTQIKVVKHDRAENINWLRITNDTLGSVVVIFGDAHLCADLEAAFNAYLSRHGRLNLEMTEKDNGNS